MKQPANSVLAVARKVNPVNGNDCSVNIWIQRESKVILEPDNGEVRAVLGLISCGVMGVKSTDATDRRKPRRFAEGIASLVRNRFLSRTYLDGGVSILPASLLNQSLKLSVVELSGR